MHITNQKFSFDIFTVGHVQNILMEHDLYLISSTYIEGNIWISPVLRTGV